MYIYLYIYIHTYTYIYTYIYINIDSIYTNKSSFSLDSRIVEACAEVLPPLCLGVPISRFFLFVLSPNPKALKVHRQCANVWWCLLKKDYNEGVTKSNPTQKCRLARGISVRVNIQITKNTDVTKQPNNE
jgi:hypothetical protein